MADVVQNIIDIRSAENGLVVRETIADGIESINEEVESTTSRQTVIEGTIAGAIELGGNPSLEVGEARKGETSLGAKIDKIDENIQNHATELANNASQLQDIAINPMFFLGTDTQKIQQALDMIHTSGSGSVILAYLYNITEPLIVYPNTIIKGGGWGTGLTTSLDISILTTPATANPLDLNVYSNIFIEDMIIKNTNATSISHYQLDFVNPCGVKIIRCNFNTPALTQTDVGGIKFSHNNNVTGSFLCTVDGCMMQQSSIVMNVTDSYIKNCEVWGYSRKFAIHVMSSSLMITDCQIVGSGVKGGVWVEDDVLGYNIELIKVNNCYFDGSYTAIDSGSGLYGVNMQHSSITNCAFWRQMDYGINIMNPLCIKIANNTFEDCNRRDNFSDDIYLHASTTFLGYNILTGNTHISPTIKINKGKWYNNLNVNYNTLAFNKVYSAGNYNGSTKGVYETIFENMDTAIPVNSIVGDLSIPNGDIVAKGGFKQSFVGYFNGITANLAVSSISFTSGNHKGIVMPTPGSILSLSLNVAAARTAGSITLQIYKNSSTAIGTPLVFSGASGNYVQTTSYAKESIPFVANDVLYVKVTSSSDSAPTNDITVTLTVEN